MIGHLKFCVTIISGCILFNDIPNMNQIAGVMFTITGKSVLIYVAVVMAFIVVKIELLFHGCFCDK